MLSEFTFYAFIVLISCVSIFVVKGDIKHKKIKNKLILVGLFGGMALFLFDFLHGSLQGAYLRDVFLNSLIALAVAYAFWSFSLWPAGDAKLFALYSFLLPLHFYWKSYLPLCPSLILLVNIFVCAYVFLLLRAFIHWIKQAWLALERGVDIRSLLDKTLSNAKGIFSSSLIAKLFKSLDFPKIGLRIGKFFLFTFVTYYIFGSRGLSHMGFIKTSLVMMAIYTLFSIAVKRHIKDNEVYVEDIDDLKIGAIPMITPQDGDLFSKEMLKKLGVMRADGLNEWQVGFLKTSFKAKGVNSINIQKSMPFSPWIVTGSLVTMFLSGSILNFFGSIWH